jgi:NAD(P)-dependent dehydrogenase (short-subunit alcohol dehydrogenase family)
LTATKLMLTHTDGADARPLRGKVILITGASRGLGRAIALAAAAAGATTLLLARDMRALEGLADEIEAAGGPAPSLVPLNLEAATVEHYEEVARLIAERWGRLDGLVLNAGSLGELSPLRTYDCPCWKWGRPRPSSSHRPRSDAKGARTGGPTRPPSSRWKA